MEAPASGRDTAPVRLCTIAATNYLSRIRVLADSVRRNGHDDGLSVFFVDDPLGTTPTAGEAFSVVTLDDIALDPVWFAQMTIYYSVTELATAVKPSVLAGLIDGAAGPARAVAYLDPDTELFAPLDDIWATCAADDAIMLTPHILRSFPIDDLDISEHMLLLSGTYNLGFVAVPASDHGRGFVDWWRQRLRFDALVSPETGLFTDQRWIDLAPALFTTRIVRDPGVNVAYWNLHERPLSRSGSTWLAAGVPLRIFHYSGFDPTRPFQVSVHQGNNPRIARSTDPELAVLLDRYADQIATNDHGGASGQPYRWAQLPNGIRLNSTLRREYRAQLMDSELAPDGQHLRPPSPEDDDWLVKFVAWLCEPVPPQLTPRHVQSLLVERRDLAATFGGLEPAQFAHAFGNWLTTWGVSSEGLTASHALRLTVALRSWADAMDKASRRGNPPKVEMVNVIGFMGAVSGLSSGARQVVKLLDQSGIANRQVSMQHPNTEAWLPSAAQDLRLFDTGPPLEPADITVVHMNADILSHIGPIGRRRIFGDSYRIGYWWWEVDVMPLEYTRALREVDEVWVGSTFVAELMGQLTDRPVFRVPLPAQTPKPGDFARARWGINDDAAMFSVVFDHASVLGRKNPQAAIAAYCDAFTPADSCTLVVKSINAHGYPIDAEEIRYACSRRPDIVLIEQRLSSDELNGLIATSTAHISLHRSEGLGLSILDACLLGVPVVASAYGGCMDFLAPDSSWLVPTSPAPVGPGNLPYPAGATWAEPDHDAAVDHLRSIVADLSGSRQRAQLAQSRAADTYDDLVCSDLIMARINQVRVALNDGVPMTVET